MLKKLLPVIKVARDSINRNFFGSDKNIYSVVDEQKIGLNLVFILPSNEASKAGGDKVIYKQCELINDMGYHGISAQILHPYNHAFKHTWFEHHASIKLDNRLSKQHDFVVIPEVMVIPHAKMLLNLGIRFAIYVQNGYSASIPLYVGSEEDLQAAYEAAEIIMTISEDTSDCIRLAFPHLADKIQRIYYSVDSDKFKPHLKKDNLITYMPRKLSRHSDLVRFFLKNQLPLGWRLAAIHGLNEAGVIDMLAQSKIFLSFSEFEGCPLPPVEAALSGNLVVGYTGEGAREYWRCPTFVEIHSGDIKSYVKEVLSAIKQLSANELTQQMSENRDYLSKRYSFEAEKNSLQAFLARIH